VSKTLVGVQLDRRPVRCVREPLWTAFVATTLPVEAAEVLALVTVVLLDLTGVIDGDKSNRSNYGGRDP
jgi:hypothetical protein